MKYVLTFLWKTALLFLLSFPTWANPDIGIKYCQGLGPNGNGACGYDECFNKNCPASCSSGETCKPNNDTSNCTTTNGFYENKGASIPNYLYCGNDCNFYKKVTSNSDGTISVDGQPYKLATSTCSVNDIPNFWNTYLTIDNCNTKVADARNGYISISDCNTNISTTENSTLQNAFQICATSPQKAACHAFNQQKSHIVFPASGDIALYLSLQGNSPQNDSLISGLPYVTPDSKVINLVTPNSLGSTSRQMIDPKEAEAFWSNHLKFKWITSNAPREKKDDKGNPITIPASKCGISIGLTGLDTDLDKSWDAKNLICKDDLPSTDSQAAPPKKLLVVKFDNTAAKILVKEKINEKETELTAFENVYQVSQNSVTLTVTPNAGKKLKSADCVKQDSIKLIDNNGATGEIEITENKVCTISFEDIKTTTP